MFLLAWVVVPGLRRYIFNVSTSSKTRSAASSSVFKPSVTPSVALAKRNSRQGNGFFGGPRQVSLRLMASKPSLGRTVLPSAKPSGAPDQPVDVVGKASQTPAYHRGEPDRELKPVTEPVFESSVRPVVEQMAKTLRPSVPEFPLAKPIFESSAEAVVEQTAESFRPGVSQTPEIADVSAIDALTGPASIVPEEPIFESSVGRVIEQTAERSRPGVPQTTEIAEVSATREPAELSVITTEEPNEIPTGAKVVRPAEAKAAPNGGVEPIEQEQPVSYEPTLPAAISTKPVFPQTTTPATMPETTEIPTAPANKPSPATVAKPQPAATMQTAVQLTFSFEIAAVQLTSSFKMGVLKVRPISKLVTMRLPASQQPQLGVNLQVSFEIAKVQPLGGALGTIRMIPSQQRPTTTGSPSFAVAGLQVVPNFETAPVQLTPSQQGRASVFVTVPFQITTIEFSPSLEIAAVVLNSNSKQVRVQLPGAGSNQSEGPAMFEIANLELNESGDIGTMQLNLLGQGPKRA
jgi:hypothetical protein